jgi:hypothetical protein
LGLGEEARLRAAACRLHGALHRARLHRGRVLLIVLGTIAVAAALRSSPALGLEVLLRDHAEGEVTAAALTVDEDGLQALVRDGAVVAPLGLLPALLLEDASLRIGEEEAALAVAAREVRARGLGALLRLATVGAAHRLGPVVLGEEDLVLAREGEGAGAVAAGELQVCRESRAVALGLLVAVATATCRLGLLGRLCSSLCLGVGLLLRHVLLDLGDALVGASQEVTDLLGVLAHREAAESVVAVGLGPHELLTVDERHFVLKVGGNLGKCAGLGQARTFNFTFLSKPLKLNYTS